MLNKMNFHLKIGLKLHSTNIELIPDALTLKKEGFFDYVELYIIPGSYEKTINHWEGLHVPFVIHAPHSYHGINLAQSGKWETNLKNFNEARLFADDLYSSIIILHSGNNGFIDETIRQIKLLNESRIILENKPKIGINDEMCIGWSPFEFHRFADAGVLYDGMALDFGHAVYAARSLGVDAIEIVNEFMTFNPKIFHLSDGNSFSEKDIHLNFGAGDFRIKEFLSVIPDNGFLTIETPCIQSRYLNNFIDDVSFLRNISCQKT